MLSAPAPTLGAFPRRAFGTRRRRRTCVYVVKRGVCLRRCLSLSLSFFAFSNSFFSSLGALFFVFHLFCLFSFAFGLGESTFCSPLQKEGPEKKTPKKRSPSSFVIIGTLVGKQRAKEKKKHGSNFCAQRHVKGAFSRKSRRDVGRVGLCARDFREDPLFFAFLFFVCVFAFGCVSFRGRAVLTPLSLSLSLCVCAMKTGDVQRRKAWKASGVGAPGVQGGHQVLASHAKARYVTESSFSRGDPNGC